MNDAGQMKMTPQQQPPWCHMSEGWWQDQRKDSKHNSHNSRVVQGMPADDTTCVAAWALLWDNSMGGGWRGYDRHPMGGSPSAMYRCDWHSLTFIDEVVLFYLVNVNYSMIIFHYFLLLKTCKSAFEDSNAMWTNFGVVCISRGCVTIRWVNSVQYLAAA